jgi:hypothetical protein
VTIRPKDVAILRLLLEEIAGGSKVKADCRVPTLPATVIRTLLRY